MKPALLRILFMAFFISAYLFLTVHLVMAQTPTCSPPPGSTSSPCVQVNQQQLGFQVPTLSDILTFAIRMFFIIGGLAALLMLLLGALAWITSGGDKDSIAKAQHKIQAALIGVILIAVVLALVATLEQVVFKRAICFGLTCPATIPVLLKKTNTLTPSPDVNTNDTTETPTPDITGESLTATPVPTETPTDTPEPTPTEEPTPTTTVLPGTGP